MSSYPYESFNARNYTPAQVAETFISSSEYSDLWKNEHSVVLGPRGSGKTTLFKMLTLQALYAWKDQYAEQLRTTRPFTAIYVPTDMHWHRQLKHAEEQLRKAPRFSLAASRAAVTTNILLAVARTFQDRILLESEPSEESESRLCSLLAQQWRLAKAIPCIDVIVLALKARIAAIRQAVNQAIFLNSTDEQLTDIPEYYHLDYLAELDVACTAFDTICRPRGAQKWAICLDELELAPEWLQNLAFSQQRSTEEQFLIKLSTSPIPKALGLTEARPKQDFRLICMWNYSGRADDSFAENLSRSVLKRRLGVAVSPAAVFGKSDLIIAVENEEADKYERGSQEWALFRNACEWDASLRQLLHNAGIDPFDPVTDDIKLRDSLLRKAKPVAILRSAFLKGVDAGKVVRRSRKLATIYYGREAVYRISDGNPRRLIGILGDLCDKLERGKDGGVVKLPEHVQAEVLTRASLHFSGYVHALPGAVTPLEGNRIDLTTLLRVIGDYFRGRMFGAKFELDPVGSFRIDSNIIDEVIELLRLGVYHGALVYVDPIPDTIETNLRGKRFRLSYMLAPLLKLPLNLHDSVSLSAILRASPPTSVILIRDMV
jgi:energy-coupling factor transporter ATP-binding protein EcfA2